MDESIAFYTNVLGFRFLRRANFGPPESRRELAYVGLGDFLLELLELPAGAMEVPSGAGQPFALTVTDMEQTVADLRSKGVEVDISGVGRSIRTVLAAQEPHVRPYLVIVVGPGFGHRNEPCPDEATRRHAHPDP